VNNRIDKGLAQCLARYELAFCSPRSVECYTDSEGNTYEFCFGLNWSGKIDDDRVATYSATPLTGPETVEWAPDEE